MRSFAATTGKQQIHLVAASNTNSAVRNGTKPFAGSCVARQCPSGSMIPVANSTSLKSTSAMSLACPIYWPASSIPRRAPKIPTFHVVNSFAPGDHTGVIVGASGCFMTIESGRFGCNVCTGGFTIISGIKPRDGRGSNCLESRIRQQKVPHDPGRIEMKWRAVFVVRVLECTKLFLKLSGADNA